MTCEEIQRDIERGSTLLLDFTSRIETISRIETVQINIQPSSTIPVSNPEAQFMIWDKIISRFIWGGKKPKVKL